jgi:hypothetical protein
MNAKKKTEGTELRELDVDRVDGVDRPATGRKFIITKAVLDEAAQALRKSQPPADSVREYDIEALNMPKLVEDSSQANAENARVAQRLESMSGQVQNATRRPAYARDAFLDPTGEWGQRPLKPYEVVEDEGIAPKNMNFAPPIVDGHGLVQPENFTRPRPKPIRAGNGYILKGERPAGFWSGTSFYDESFYDEAGRRAIEKKAEKEQWGEADFSDLTGPSRWREKAADREE